METEKLISILIWSVFVLFISTLIALYFKYLNGKQ